LWCPFHEEGSLRTVRVESSIDEEEFVHVVERVVDYRFDPKIFLAHAVEQDLVCVS